MANTKISQLAAGAPAQATDIIPVDRGGTNVSLQVSDIENFIAATPSFSGGVVSFVDDFLGAAKNVANISASGTVYTSNGTWLLGPLTGGTTGAIQQVAALFTNPGNIKLITPATTNDGLWMILGGSEFSILGSLNSFSPWTMDYWFQTPASLANICFRFGFSDGSSFTVDGPTNGVWLEFDTANANSNTNFELVNSNGGTKTYTSSGIAPVASTWYHVRLSSTVAGTMSAQMSVANAGLGAAFSSAVNVPNSNFLPTLQIVARANAAVNVVVDCFAYNAVLGRN
jgi:hypothetical protein